MGEFLQQGKEAHICWGDKSTTEVFCLLQTLILDIVKGVLLNTIAYCYSMSSQVINARATWTGSEATTELWEQYWSVCGLRFVLFQTAPLPWRNSSMKWFSSNSPSLSWILRCYIQNTLSAKFKPSTELLYEDQQHTTMKQNESFHFYRNLDKNREASLLCIQAVQDDAKTCRMPGGNLLNRKKLFKLK